MSKTILAGILRKHNTCSITYPNVYKYVASYNYQQKQETNYLLKWIPWNFFVISQISFIVLNKNQNYNKLHLRKNIKTQI